tara:strand:+ start:191 stop:394 length:204 start_codon:yes stop_codon:yes gene_type:complete
METLEETLRHTSDWVVDRISILTEEMDPERLEDAFSIEREFKEWLDPADEHQDIYSLEYIGEGSEYD